MKPESSEEMMFKTLMKWSHIEVEEPESLEERLLCVQISETSLEVIMTVMEAVSSITTFVRFLPLANRICIEMADSSSVTQVVEKYKTFSPDSPNRRVACVKSLKQRLQDASENIELDNVGAKPPAGKTAGPSAAVASDVAMEEDGKKPGTEISTDSAVGLKANEDEDPVTAVKTQTDAAVSEQRPAASAPSSTAHLTTEELIEKHLDPMKIVSQRWQRCISRKKSNMQLIITGLPEFSNGRYTEEDVARKLIRSGFEYDDVNNIYIVPQKRMLPSSQKFCSLSALCLSSNPVLSTLVFS
ncbi:uncharacterized protein ABDE67_020493 [Symphorus nematophorus]